jgi:hypothetical protein
MSLILKTPKPELLHVRPYSITSFEKNISLFKAYINSVTFKQSEDPPEVRRQKLIGEWEVDSMALWN